MTFGANLTMLLRSLKRHWFIILCLLSFGFVTYLSAQVIDTFSLIILTVLLWICVPSAAFLFWVAIERAAWRKPKLKPYNLVVFGICCLLSFSIALVQWPFKINYRLSHAALVREARQPTFNKPAYYPRRVGGFYVRAGGDENGCACFWTDTHPSGRTGIVYCPNGDKPPFNLWDSTSLGGNWHAIKED
jgi:hypothetical protein